MTNKILKSALIGAGTMYFFDPEKGPARRDYVNRSVRGFWNDLNQLLSRTRNLGNRSQIQAHEQSLHAVQPEIDSAKAKSTAPLSPLSKLLTGATSTTLFSLIAGRGGLMTRALGSVGLEVLRQKLAKESEAASRSKSVSAFSQPARATKKGQPRSDQTVGEIMTPAPACCLPDTPLAEVAAQMVRFDCGSIPVIEFHGNRPIGIITDRDITARSVAEGKNPLELTAKDCMTSPVDTVYEDTTVEACCNRMEAMQIRRMLVTDKEGKCIGVVSQADIAIRAPEHETIDLIKDVSTPSPTATV
ncbi:MAG: CBS domain-containing protein [Planctomycetota bacterium]|nr:CBS domain-containing protein [Planctomycetota bacterium]